MVVFLAAEALADGIVTRHGLSAHHRRVLPGVYAPKHAPLTLQDRILAAWLWSGRNGVVTGLAASAMHGARWVDHGIPIEMNLLRDKSPTGVIALRDTLLDGEVVQLRGLAVTSVERTAFDLARRGSTRTAVERLDALARVKPFAEADILAVLDRHPHVRGRRQVPAALALVDSGAQSPKETWLRMLLIEAGFPRPQTQIPVTAPNGARYYLDMGWEELRVAVEYDGEQHRTDSRQYRGDVMRAEIIDGLGWRRIRVLAGHHRDDIVRRVAQAGVPRSLR